MEIQGKRIVITGTSSGIGKDTLKLLSEYKDVKLLCVDHIENPNREEYNKDSVHFLKIDISQPENIETIMKTAMDRMGGIDIFFANAGFAYYEEIQKPSWYRIEKIFTTNVFSPFYSLTYLNHNSKNPFLFIVTASAMSHLPIPGYSLYAATKASVHAFMNCFRYELKKENRIMVVYPIATRSQFFDTAGSAVPLPFPSQTSQSVAKSIVRGILRNKTHVYPSKVFRVMQIFDRFLLFPLKLYQKIEGKKFRDYLNHKT